MPAEGHLALRRNQSMVNFRVHDLGPFVEKLRRSKVAVDPIEAGPDGEGIGKFAHIRGSEGNRVELWERSTGV